MVGAAVRRVWRARILVRRGEHPKRTTIHWNVRCGACGRLQNDPRGTMMRVIKR
jgi:hypothetical protein